eukprot:jgi/Chlat1/3734/Chrsp259S03877
MAGGGGGKGVAEGRGDGVGDGVVSGSTSSGALGLPGSSAAAVEALGARLRQMMAQAAEADSGGGSAAMGPRRHLFWETQPVAQFGPPRDGGGAAAEEGPIDRERTVDEVRQDPYPLPEAFEWYWHRSLNPKKLIDVGFSRLQARMTMNRTIKLYRLPDSPSTPGLRQMRPQDVTQVTNLLHRYLEQFYLAPVMSEEEVAHLLLPRPEVVSAYVVDDPLKPGIVTDLISFYALPSTIIGNDTYKVLKAAYSFYNVANTLPLIQLMTDALILARNEGFDVFNALDVMHNSQFLKELKFGIGDGHLQYYLYNWLVPAELKPTQVGLVLL